MRQKLIIIGGGISGLSAGIYALENGLDVTIIEKNPYLGGFCRGYYKGNNYIDICIHWFTGTKEYDPINKIWNDIGAINKNTKIIELPSLCSYENKFHLYRDMTKSMDEWIQNAPEDELEIKNFFQMAKRFIVFNLMNINKPYEQLEAKDVMSMVKNKYGKLYSFVKSLKISRKEYAKKFKNKELRTFLENAQPGYCSLFCLLYVYTNFVNGDCDLISGGALPLVNNIKSKYESLGGKYILNEEVNKIIIKNNKAIGVKAKNASYFADYIISCCDSIYAMNKLLDKRFKHEKMIKCYEDTKNYNLPSAFQVTLLVEGDLSKFDTSNIISIPSIKIGKHFFKTMTFRNYSYEPSVYVKNNKTLCHLFIDQTNEDYSFWEEIKNKNKYETHKQNLAKKLCKAFINKYPNFKNKLQIIDIFTPLTLNKFNNATCGAYMSFSIKDKKNAFVCDGRIEGLNNFLLSGQFVSSPGGLPFAAATGKYAIIRMCKDLNKEYKEPNGGC
ncbi:MAG: NAD(P)-binding protein [Bacilli bacterium]|nr:NAD(P)-binding protein [Bacilli bacterium]